MPSIAGATMKKFGSSVVVLVAFGVCFWLAREGVRYLQGTGAQAFSTIPGLSREFRDGFTGAAIRTCFENQSRAPENAGLTKQVLTSYCVCFANGMADRISDATLKSLDGVPDADRVKRMQPVIDAAYPACLKEIQATAQR
ncbi:hypothetical protein HNR60_001593 [Rhodopseudomonas rhenobacensis]|uniref:Uncharacterized protein n=1 Tax=Rhodopseudomonas rhenobacensis TaxID=87461 RepID=A0A7W7Z2P8_9BRAD|nr:hypothetical protein [Rhodopseudomonas rhenobacensis]MBB5046844.1 hypothetical protein [Rhodopseudomonas rhenobacensis]